MKEKLIKEIMQGMLGCLSNEQLEHLQEVLAHSLFSVNVTETENKTDSLEKNEELLDLFIAAKRIEGCSEKSLTYYKTTIEVMMQKVNKSVKQIETDDLRSYLTDYQREKQSSKVTIDNIRRILSSFLHGWELKKKYQKWMFELISLW